MTLPLSWNEIQNRSVTFAKEWAGTHSEDADAKPFWDAFFEVFGVSPKTTPNGVKSVTLVKVREANEQFFMFFGTSR